MGLTDDQWLDIDIDALKFFYYWSSIEWHVKHGFTPEQAVELTEMPDVPLAVERPEHPRCRTSVHMVM
jgi:hypothetical protein